MTVIFFVCLLLMAGAAFFAYLRLEAQNDSILGWVMHVNDKLTRIENSTAELAAHAKEETNEVGLMELTGGKR